MKIANFFRKPRWQSKDATTRRDAVARDNAPELVAELSRFAREDEDAQVRLTALRRLADPAIGEIEINPLVARGGDAVALDALITVAQ